jgi:hypothetical protein
MDPFEATLQLVQYSFFDLPESFRPFPSNLIIKNLNNKKI